MTKYMETKLRTELIEPETPPPTPEPIQPRPNSMSSTNTNEVSEPIPEPKKVVRKRTTTKKIESVEAPVQEKPTPIQEVKNLILLCLDTRQQM